MKLTKSRLKRLIKEELQKVLMQEQAPWEKWEKDPSTMERSEGSPIEMPVKTTPARNETEYAQRVAVSLCQAGWSIREQQKLFRVACGTKGTDCWTVQQLIKSVRGTNGNRYGLSRQVPNMRNDLASCKRLVGSPRPRRTKKMTKWQCAKICAGQDQAACRKCMQATGGL